MKGPTRSCIRSHWLRALLILAGIALLLSASAPRTRQARQPGHAVARHLRVAPHVLGDLPAPDATDLGIAVDLYGNEVTDAVAEYGLDSTGDLFERHSPQIELPRLASPKS